MTMRPYDHERDFEHARRMWREAGWFEADREGLLEASLPTWRGWVALLRQEAECFVGTTDCVMRHLEVDIPATCIGTVMTSRVGRRQGFGLRLTARALADDVRGGAILATLGIFDQGYYDKLGFGNGGPMRLTSFDPTKLRVAPPARPPLRLTKDDYEEMHALRLKRVRRHGGCNIHNPMITRTTTEFSKDSFGLGYRDQESGELTHCFWCRPVQALHGPYYIWWIAYQRYAGLLELLGVMKTLGDQVYSFRMADPPGLSMQLLLAQPFRQRDLTDEGAHGPKIFAWQGWQARICDLPACLERIQLPGAGTVRFNLKLSDPIEHYLDEDSPWRGIGGDYVVTLGRESSARPGSEAGLPTLRTSVNALTKLWFGAQPAGTLAVTDHFDAPADLVHALDRTIILPQPHADWDY